MNHSTMTALLLTDAGPRVATEHPVPQPGPGEALVRVRVAGICATDLELVRGYKGGYRGILGHEFVGEIAAAPDAPNRIGERVVGEINVGCGRCDLCARGLHKHCRQRRVLGIQGLDGAFAHYLVLPLANLHTVPATVPDDAAVFAEPLAAAFQIAEQQHITPSMRVYVLGSGRLGQLIGRILRGTGCNLTLLGRNPATLEVAACAGIPVALLAQAESQADVEELARRPADLLVEATGSEQGFALAQRLVRPGGTIVLKSTFAGTLRDFDAGALVVNEVTVVGSRCGPFAPALEALQRGTVDVRPLVHTRYPLAQADAALAHAAQPGVLKVLLDA